jgi:hypothetical protein
MKSRTPPPTVTLKRRAVRSKFSVMTTSSGDTRQVSRLLLLLCFGLPAGAVTDKRVFGRELVRALWRDRDSEASQNLVCIGAKPRFSRHIRPQW